MLAAAVLLTGASLIEAFPNLKISNNNNNVLRDQYIIRLKSNQKLEQLRSHIQEVAEDIGGFDMQLGHVFENLVEHGVVGYSARLTRVGLNILLKHDIIESIEDDQIRHLYDCQQQTKDVDWGLARTNDANFTHAVSYQYQYTTGSTGRGVDAYVIDTGIYCENNDFVNKKFGTCSFGFSAVKSALGVVDVTDGNGHGTHVSGSIAGFTYGVAKEADLIAVKVMSDRGSGSSSNILAGIDWVVGNVKKTKKPSVANLSIGGGFSQTENDAIKAATQAGVVMVVAAGNEDSDACDTSPASEPSAITVAASDDKNIRASYSNWGSCVDVFGPGSNIKSTWIDAPDATNTISGTSMASPHVCGVAAKILSANPTFTVTQVTNKLINDSINNQISDVKGTPNRIVFSSCV